MIGGAQATAIVRIRSDWKCFILCPGTVPGTVSDFKKKKKNVYSYK